MNYKFKIFINLYIIALPAISYFFFNYFNTGISFWNIHHHNYDHDLIFKDFKNIIYIFNQPIVYVLYNLVPKYIQNYNNISQELVVIFIHYVFSIYTLICYKEILKHFKLENFYFYLSSIFLIFTPSFYIYFTFFSYDFLSFCLVIIVFKFSLEIAKYEKPIFLFFFWTFILSNFRNFFHPIFFIIPLYLGMFFFVNEKFKKNYIFISILFILLCNLNFVKNYFLFDRFEIGTGPIARIKAHTTYEFDDPDKLVKYINEGKMHPFNLCLNQKGHKNFMFEGNLYNNENCNLTLPRALFEKEIKDFLNKHPNLRNVSFLNDYAGSKIHTHFNMAASYIPNTITGLVASIQVIKDSEFYESQNSYQFSNIKKSIYKWLKSNNSYIFNIGNNYLKYPNWFGYHYWNLDPFPAKSEHKLFDKIDTEPRIIAVLIIMFSLFHMIFILLENLFKIKVNFALKYYILILITISLFFKNYPQLIYILNFLWFGFAILLILLILFKLLSNYNFLFKLPLFSKNILILFGLFLYYYVVLHWVTVAEVERYRFPIDGLISVITLICLSKYISIYQRKNLIKNNIKIL